MTSITVSGVTKTFGTITAVNDVSFTVEPGELFFLLGSSGCGKTTVMRLLAGFYTPDTGSIKFGDRDVTSLPPQKRNTAMVFQNYALWPHMTVAANVAYGLQVRKLPKPEITKRVTATLAITGLDDYAERYPNELSGGQQQRVALARAIIVEPDLLLFDEPLSNLDAKLRHRMRDEIKRIHAETGITTLYVTHDQEEALSMADRMAVMDNGRILQTAAPREVYHYPSNRFVAEFIGEANLIPGTVAEPVPEYGLAVTTALGTVYSTLNTDAFSPGDDVLCMVRPESARVGTDALNTFEGRITEVTYLGGTERYTLESAGLSLTALETNAFAERPGEGDIATVSFAPDQVVLIKK